MARRQLPSVQEQVDATISGAQSKGVTNYKKNVARVTESPTAKAARNLDKAKAGFIQAVDSGRMAAGLNAVSTQQWITQTVTKGGANYGTGMAASRPKMTAGLSAFRPKFQQVLDEIDAMPTDTIEQRAEKSKQYQIALYNAKHGRV